MRWSLPRLVLPFTFVAWFLVSPAHTYSLDEIAKRYTRRTAHGIHLPIVKQVTNTIERRALFGVSGLGDYFDVAYTVVLMIGGVTTPFILDTGSSDLWTLSDACLSGCTHNGSHDVRVYPQSTFNSSGLDVEMLYGDSRTGTFARGVIGNDTVHLAGMTMQDQYFAAINVTNTSVLDVGAAGILGLGFPVNSVIWNSMFQEKYDTEAGVVTAKKRESIAPLARPNFKWGSQFPDLHFRRLEFPSVSGILGTTTGKSARRTTSLISSALASWASIGPLLARTVMRHQLMSPMFTITLQRDTIDVGGNAGMLSIGEMPSGVSEDKLTWVPLRNYTYDEGGLPAPPDSPGEVYPIAWEVMIDDVYFNGEKLPRSNISSSSIALSALIDTGSSLIRGPADVVQYIFNQLGHEGQYPCSNSHSLAFSIGNKLFPVDPRDFAAQVFPNSVEVCYPNIAVTDPPREDGYRFSWSMGTPFLKSVLTCYHYGNLSYPSQDPPKMGFLSTVPSDANGRMQHAASAAAKANNNFPSISEPAPTGSFVKIGTNAQGVPQATYPKTNSASRCVGPAVISVGVLGFALLFITLW
ncbi:acid protease [Phlegmacium glaucopus]|nr:acid protease [Phlegmacium glaucopus]